MTLGRRKNPNLWTVEFGNYDLEIRPTKLDLRLTRQQYDYCRATFNPDVGELIDSLSRYATQPLRSKEPVEIKYDGQTVRWLLWRPDYVSFQEGQTDIEFHDLQKSLQDGQVDIERKFVGLRKIYRDVIEASSQDILEPPKSENFVLPEGSPTVASGDQAFGGPIGDYIDNVAEGLFEIPFVQGDVNPTSPGEFINSLFNDSIARVVNGSKAIDFNNISPATAIERLNKLFGLRTWVNEDNELMVGMPETAGSPHLSAPNDSRVFRWKSPSISPPDEPIRRVIIEGGWVDETGIGGPGDIIDETKQTANSLLPFLNSGSQGGADVKKLGIAKRTDIDRGKTVWGSTNEKNTDSLQKIATLQLRREMVNQNTGNITIDPLVSGEQYSNIIDLRPGDFLQVVPTDVPFDNPTATSGGSRTDFHHDEVLGGMLRNDIFVTQQVRHRKGEDGGWEIDCDLALYPTFADEEPVDTFTQYYNPVSNERVGKEEIEDFELIESGVGN